MSDATDELRSQCAMFDLSDRMPPPKWEAKAIIPIRDGLVILGELDSARAEIAALREQLARARSDALEEAAQTIERQPHPYGRAGSMPDWFDSTVAKGADRIRGLAHPTEKADG
jgi:hypothetical protein